MIRRTCRPTCRLLLIRAREYIKIYLLYIIYYILYILKNNIKIYYYIKYIKKNKLSKKTIIIRAGKRTRIYFRSLT